MYRMPIRLWSTVVTQVDTTAAARLATGGDVQGASGDGVSIGRP